MSRYHYDYIYTHRTRHSMRKVYLGLVSQSIGRRILIQSQYSETKVSKKRTPDMKTTEKKHSKCEQRNMTK